MNKELKDFVNSSIINNQNLSTLNLNNCDDETYSIKALKEISKNEVIVQPLPECKNQVMPLEKELLECLNLEWGVDAIYEDIPLIDENNNNYYIHLLRTANPDPNKENFILIHGFLSSSLHFTCVLPYMIKRYNVFIPDTIGMGLSCRPKINFTSPEQCENYFISKLHLLINELFFNGRFNIKKEYYLCGHSLGGFFSSRYMLRYPKGIKKVLLLSPAGITDYTIPGTDFFEHTSCCWYCAIVCAPTCVWPCKLRLQRAYGLCCCKSKIKQAFGNKKIHIYENEVKNNPDGSKFFIDYPKISSILKKLTFLSLEYPKDLYKCAYYLFAVPPPSSFRPIEKNIMYENKIDVIFAFGQKDWMDRNGSYRLSKFDPKKYKVFTISNCGHSFARQNPEELCSVIEEYFPQ